MVTELTSDSIDYMRLDIMTNGRDDKPKELCQLIINRHELEDLLEDIPTVDYRGTENQ